MTQSPAQIVAMLRTQVLDPLRREFAGRDEVVDLIALAVASGEHLFLYGPPGTAKSALIRGFASRVRSRCFEYLLTRFSEPNEIFGPVDLTKLREGIVATVITRMLPEAEFAFLDELFNANSAILNNLLTVLNERVYRRGAETHKLPLLSLFSASNSLPEDDTLGALFDRFLLRCPVQPLSREMLPALLRAGWNREAHPVAPPSPADPGETGDPITGDHLRRLSAEVLTVDLGPVEDAYADAVVKLRDLGIAYSDRRAVRGLKLIAASAVLCGRSSAAPSDLWVLRYVWDRAEQIGPLASLIRAMTANHLEGAVHPQARGLSAPDAEEIAIQVADIAERIGSGATKSLMDQSRARESLTRLHDRVAWLPGEAKTHLMGRIADLLKKLGR